MVHVERVPIPTPFSVGPVNSYVFAADDDLAVLDPGPRTDEAYAELTAGLERTGNTAADVDRILITHSHMDHYGLAARLAAESGASVLAHEAAVERLADPDGFLEREQSFFRPFLARMGVPGDIVDTVVDLPEPYADFREAVTVDRPLADGDRVDVGVSLETVHTPGHTPDAVCFVGEAAAYTGDHVMADISPNPLLTLAPGTDDERTRSLPDYLASLRRIREYGDLVGRAGHRETVADLGSRADEILAHHDERAETVADLVAEAAPVTAHEVMQRLFPDLPLTEAFPGMSETLGHLDLLEDADRVETVEDGGVVRYRPT